MRREEKQVLNNMANDESRSIKPHFVVFPFLAQGHLIPMADISCLLAKHGAKVTILTTPANAARIEPVISRTGLSIDVVHLEFPGPEFGLPKGVENLHGPETLEEISCFHKAVLAMSEQVHRLLAHGLSPPPSCLLADIIHLGASEVARAVGIPRVVFTVDSCFDMLISHMQVTHNDFEGIPESETGYIVVPDLPHRIEMTKAQLRGTVGPYPDKWLAFVEKRLKIYRESLGTVVNTFRELEPEYVAACEKLTGQKFWCLGPVSLSSAGDPERGNKPSVGGHECSKWLDSKDPGSVLYICFGSHAPIGTAQLVELGLALESLSYPFMWVVKGNEELERWLTERGFEEKVGGRGFIIRGWAPQALILSHPSVGGFLSHCGWNSTLEAVSCGVPMLTWPLMLDQFYNERFIVDVIKLGVRGGLEVPIGLGTDANAVGVQAKSGDVERAINRLMDTSKEGEERRERARKLAGEAKRAVEEGGSSYADIDRLIQDVMNCHQQQHNV